MYRINFLLAAFGLLIVGCSKSTTAPGDSPAPPQTVTANKPAAPDEVPSEETTPATEPADEAAQPEAQPQGEDAAQRVTRELGETGDAIADFAAETKETLVEKAEQRLAELDGEIAELEAKTQDLKDDAQARWEESKQELELKRQEFAQQLEQLKNSSDDAWKTFADGIAQAYKDLKQACQKSADQFAKEELE